MARLDQGHLRKLIEEQALDLTSMDASKVQEIREQMERMLARRLQPHFIEAFFLEAFQHMGGTVRPREKGRYEIAHVPATIRSRDRLIGTREPVLQRYERICFEKQQINVPGKPPAAFVCPGHPLLNSLIDLILERHCDLLKEGAVLVDEADPGDQVRALVYLEHSIQDARSDANGSRRKISTRMQYVEIEAEGTICNAGQAPYLNYRPLRPAEQTLIEAQVKPIWSRQDLENQAKAYAVRHLVLTHLQDIRQQKEELIDKTIAAVKDRLTKEINYWDKRAEDLKLQEEMGKPNAKINSGLARQRADELHARHDRRLKELQQERQLSASAPIVTGCALIVPIGLVQRLQGKRQAAPDLFARETKRVELLAMQAVMAAERELGCEPRDVSGDRCGYDIESRIPGTGSKLRFIEVKGRIEAATTVTVTKNEILTALNRPESFVLALVQVPQSKEFSEGDVFRLREASGAYGDRCVVRYVQQPFQREPDFGVTSVNYDWKQLWEQGQSPV